MSMPLKQAEKQGVHYNAWETATSKTQRKSSSYHGSQGDESSSSQKVASPGCCCHTAKACTAEPVPRIEYCAHCSALAAAPPAQGWLHGVCQGCLSTKGSVAGARHLISVPWHAEGCASSGRVCPSAGRMDQAHAPQRGGGARHVHPVRRQHRGLCGRGLGPESCHLCGRCCPCHPANRYLMCCGARSRGKNNVGRACQPTDTSCHMGTDGQPRLLRC